LRLVPFACMPSPIARQDRRDRSLVLSHQLQPSLDSRRVSSCITLFVACTAITFVTAYKLAKSPKRPSTPEASAASLPPLLLRLLPGGANQFPGGFFFLPTEDQRLFTAHENSGLVISIALSGPAEARNPRSDQRSEHRDTAASQRKFACISCDRNGQRRIRRSSAARREGNTPIPLLAPTSGACPGNIVDHMCAAPTRRSGCPVE
jgi:hypothetical protein